MVSLLVRRRRIASRLSPFFATLLLTAAAFLLPSVGDGKIARASVDPVTVAAVHVMSHAGAGVALSLD